MAGRRIPSTIKDDTVYQIRVRSATVAILEVLKGQDIRNTDADAIDWLVREEAKRRGMNPDELIARLMAAAKRQGRVTERARGSWTLRKTGRDA